MAGVYRALAKTVGTQMEVGEGYLLAQSLLLHPLVNFGFADSLTPYSARELADKVTNPKLSIYLDAKNSVANALMRRNGFTEAFAMVCLVSPPISAADADGLSPVLSFKGLTTAFCYGGDRRPAAEFMLRQFFQHHDRGSQEVFWRALEAAEELPIATVSLGGEIVAAGLITRETGAMMSVTGPVGIFNFCVDPRYQKRGVGSDFLGWLRGSHPGQESVVQCSEKIANWYEKRGFIRQTSVIAYRKIETYPK